LAVSRRGAWRDWTLFFLQGVLEQARDASDRARRLNDLRGEWRDRLTAARASAHALKLAESLFVSPLLSIPQAQKLLDVAYPTAQRSIEKLVEAGILQQAGEQNYGKSYAAKFSRWWRPALSDPPRKFRHDRIRTCAEIINLRRENALIDCRITRADLGGASHPLSIRCLRGTPGSTPSRLHPRTPP
jgi:hypothetical protein